MAIRADQLPLEVRKKLGLTKPVSKAKSRRGVGDGQPCPGRCSCGEVFDRYTRWERHWSPGCRWIIDL